MLFLAMFNSFLLAPARCCSSKMCSEKSVKRQNDRQTFGAFREAVVHGPFRCFTPRRRSLARNVTFVSSFRCLPSLLSESHFMKCNCFFCFFFFLESRSIIQMNLPEYQLLDCHCLPVFSSRLFCFNTTTNMKVPFLGWYVNHAYCMAYGEPLYSSENNYSEFEFWKQMYLAIYRNIKGSNG